jgi:hypothetical protein
MPKTVEVTAELRDWRFNKKHQLEGRIYNDKRNIGFLDGDYACVRLIRYVADYGDHIIIKTSSGTAFLLLKEHEAYRHKEQNVISLNTYREGRA